MLAERAVTHLRMEVGDALRSRWFAFACALYLGVFGLFVWLGLRESSVLGFTGVSRVLLNVANAVVIVVPLLALVATSQSVVRARTTGAFELTLVQPCRRRDWFAGMVGSRLFVLFVPLAAALLIATLGGLLLDPGDAALGRMALRTFLVSAALVWAYVGIGVWLSSLARTAERAIVYALLAWIGCAALHDFALIGALLHVHLPARLVFGLAALNPVEAARIAILTGADPELSVLGPVGFWIANALGSSGSLVIGAAWPFVVGTATLLLAARRFRRIDLIG
jgi:ABC-2 type transport system permease protein